MRILLRIFVLIILAFSFWLMFSTFGYDGSKHQLTFGSKLWSDFGAHIPLIRSFSFGNNWPPESPLFPGEPIRYHFLFYALVGILEKIGLRLDWALNLPSALGFFLMLLMIFLLSYKLFTNYWISFFSVIFTLFNGSLSFIYFFQKYPLSWNSLGEIIHSQHFASFGPWDGKLVSAFWSLNIYTNQRHLGLSFGLALLVIYLCIKKAKPLVIGLLLGILIFVNLPAAACVLLFLGWFFVVKKDFRFTFLLTLPVLLLFYLLYRHYTLPSGQVFFNPGYLIANPLSILSFLTYWFYNLGLHLILIPLGLIFAPKKIKIIFLVPLTILFILPNLFQFSPDMINNHKFFNFFILLGNIFSAYAIVKILTLKKIGKVIGSVLFIGLIFSGIIDFFPILNDSRGGLVDYRANPDAYFFYQQTPVDSVVLNSTWFYHPAQLAGRKTFYGYPYFTWSYGYQENVREQIYLAIYRATDLPAACKLLRQNQIDYVELSPHPETYLKPNLGLWNSLLPVYHNPETGLKIIEVAKICD